MTFKDSVGAVTKEVEYTYDVDNRRIAKVIDWDGAGSDAAETVRYVYDGDHIALQFDGNGNLTNRYLHGPMIDQVLADEKIVNDVVDEVVWALTDHQGTVRDLATRDATTGTTNVDNHRVFDSFGNVTSETAPAVDHVFAYTGRELDEETGLYYYRNRYYDPVVGRFVSEDPLGFDGQDANLVRYVHNRLTTSVDPSGLVDWLYGIDPREKAKRDEIERRRRNTVNGTLTKEYIENELRSIKISNEIGQGILDYTPYIPPYVSNRIAGVGQTAGGLLELLAGGALWFVPDATVTKVLGTAVIVHGADNTGTGIYILVTGEHANTLTYSGTKWGAKGLGFDENTAGWLAFTTDSSIGLASGPAVTRQAQKAILRNPQWALTAQADRWYNGIRVGNFQTGGLGRATGVTNPAYTLLSADDLQIRVSGVMADEAHHTAASGRGFWVHNDNAAIPQVIDNLPDHLTCPL